MLLDAAYGKSRVRLVRVTRRGDRHDIRDLTVAIRFEGRYEESYTEGDNTQVLPTDTMKNTVYALAARDGIDEPEHFGVALTNHFLERNERLDRVTVDLVDHAWDRLQSGDRPHGTAFVRGGADTRTARVSRGRSGVQVSAGIADLVILKSSRSAFANYLRDEFTTLRETHDRILATALTTEWHYDDAAVDFGITWRAVRTTLLETFASHDSLSVQHTLFDMGEAVLKNVEAVSSIRLVMPNKHHLPVDLTPFGLQNRNEIFVATEEPHGLIEATVAR
jgi:urate oxidase